MRFVAPITRIERRSLPDPSETSVEIVSPDGVPIGTLTFDGKGTSRLAYAPGQAPHRRWPLKAKHRRR